MSEKSSRLRIWLLRSGRALAASALPALIAAYNIWLTNLRPREFLLVPPSVIYVVSSSRDNEPELLEAPVLIQNIGARSGIAVGVSITLTSEAGQTRTYYAFEIGRFTREKSATGSNEKFKPLVIQGRDSKVENYIFAPSDNKTGKVVESIGLYRVTMSIVEPQEQELDFIDKWRRRVTVPSEFAVRLTRRPIPEVPFPLRTEYKPPA